MLEKKFPAFLVGSSQGEKVGRNVEAANENSQVEANQTTSVTEKRLSPRLVSSGDLKFKKFNVVRLQIAQKTKSNKK